jgi:hypothetical protein
MPSAQEALGHNTCAIHELRAKGALAICPVLETYETRICFLASDRFHLIAEEPRAAYNYACKAWPETVRLDFPSHFVP